MNLDKVKIQFVNFISKKRTRSAIKSSILRVNRYTRFEQQTH
jgi:hypothetical protein